MGFSPYVTEQEIGALAPEVRMSLDSHSALLPVHGFVLAGGKSSRMGQDKALLPFCGRPMIEIAVGKLREFCAAVSIVGNREDLSDYAPVVMESRIETGPAAGIEAGLRATQYPWTMFIPVDVPLVSSALLRSWASHQITSADAQEHGSSLVTDEEPQPAFCMLKTSAAETWTAALDGGERRLLRLLAITSAVMQDASVFMAEPKDSPHDRQLWFSNVNTPQDLAEAEAYALENAKQTFF
jgi:molybdopterin-guanine dinucleotide biosynthesis protein A